MMQCEVVFSYQKSQDIGLCFLQPDPSLLATCLAGGACSSIGIRRLNMQRLHRWIKRHVFIQTQTMMRLRLQVIIHFKQEMCTDRPCYTPVNRSASGKPTALPVEI